ncbi:MAG: hypothetical protein HKN76_01305, partial [Saprospiraceae bacterium]|nr:hypothetical protein [Saprospiraceae bacterium]
DMGCVVTPPAGIAPNLAVQIAPGKWRCEFWLYDLDTIGPELYCKGAEVFSGPFALNNWNIVANPLGAPVTGSFFDPLATVDTSAVPYQLKINSYYDPSVLPAKETEFIGGVGPFIQNAELKYLAAKEESFDFGWTFNLEPFALALPPATSRGSTIDYATVTLYMYLNDEEFAIIEGDDLELFSSNSRNLNGGVLLTESRHGLLSIPLKLGDELILRASWTSPSRATLLLYGQNIVSTSQEACAAHTYIPPLYAADDWTGVKQVKARVESVGTFIMSYDAADSCWVSHERIKLPKNGEYYKVYYEAFDSCHNYSIDSCYIYVKDRVKPVPVMDKSISVTLSDKKVWLGVDAFDEGSSDNCGVNLVLIRRADWQEACVDLCSKLDTCYISKHHDTIWQPVLETNKDIDEVEAHYANILKWLCEDETLCGEIVYNAWIYDLMKYASLECKEHAYDFDFKKVFKQAYDSSAVFRNKFDTCDPDSLETLTTEERFSPFHFNPGDLVDLYEQLGGGWSDAVPFSCDDACGPVVVEMMVMDYWCNWTKIWDQVWVEDKTPPKVVKDVLTSETISCKTYRDNRYAYTKEQHPVSIEYLVEKGKTGDVEAFSVLDQIFGGYEKAWLDPYGNYVDSNGDSIQCDITFFDSTCDCTTRVEKIYVYDEHLGYYWKDSLITDCFYEQDTLTFQKGIIAVNCAENVFCEQEIWCEIDHCGEGYLHRKFKIWQSCADSFYYHQQVSNTERHPVDTIYRHQRIYIGNNCELNKYMFTIPADTTINVCGVQYDRQGNVTGDAGPENTGYVKYKFDDNCRLIGIGHQDKVFKIVGGDEACYKIVRTWYLADWCGVGGEPVKENWWEYAGLVLDSCVQHILVIDETPPVCEIKGPVMPGDTVEMGGCAYQLNAKIMASDLCGLTQFDWELKIRSNQGDFTLLDDGDGILNASDEEFTISSPGLLPGDYKLIVHVKDECNNESYCDYPFSIKSVKKPTAICFTSLTVKLTPWDRDQDGVVDTAHAIVWASECNRSSSPTCGDDSVEYRLELLTGNEDDNTAAGDLDFLELGCADIGTRMVRLWVISHPSKTVDYCDLVLVVQSDYDGCPDISATNSGPLNKDLQQAENRPANRQAMEGGQEIHLSPSPLSSSFFQTDKITLAQNYPN